MVSVESGTKRVEFSYVKEAEAAQLLKELQRQYDVQQDLHRKNVIGSMIVRIMHPELHDDANTFSMASSYPDYTKTIVLRYD